MKNFRTVLKLAKFLWFFLMVAFCSVVYADGCGIPFDSSGDTIPTATGGIAFLKMPNALCADHGEYTWDYSGTVQNESQAFSLQASIVQFSRTGASGLGLHTLDFGFKDNGAWFYSNSTYGGENQIMQAVANSIDTVQSSASLNQLSVSAKSILNSSGQWTISSEGAEPMLPLFKGLVGQPGRQYQITGTGTTFLWRYDAKTGASAVEPYTYSFTVAMQDEMGAMMEGIGGGYVGPQLIPADPSTNSTEYNVESEISQPRLRILNWHIHFQATGVAANGYLAQYDFFGNKGMLWNDFGPVNKAHSQNTLKDQALSAFIQRTIPESVMGENKISDPKGLYNGNWLPVEFTSGKYAGAALVFTVFWNSSAQYAIGQSTSDLALSNVGWCNFFSGLIPNQPESAFSMLETLYPQNPGLPSISDAVTRPPYKIVFNRYESQKYGLAAPWVKTLTMTIKANTPLRYALAAYANTLANSTTADDPTKDLMITVQAISPITQNTLFSNTVTQFYEGAAIPAIDGKPVGYAWIEQMRNS